MILWKSLDHPNILRLVGVCRWDDTPEARLTMVSAWMPNGNITEYTKNNESQRMELVCESASWCNSETNQFLSSSIVQGGCNIFTGRVSFTETSRAYGQLSQRICQFTNSSRVDLQANILITSDNPVRACLADFGFTAIVSDEANGPGGTSALGGGTVPFMAPELLCPSHFERTKCQVSREADVYAFGMVILQVCIASAEIPDCELKDGVTLGAD